MLLQHMQATRWAMRNLNRHPARSGGFHVCLHETADDFIVLKVAL